jgi:hypothetical protein
MVLAPLLLVVLCFSLLVPVLVRVFRPCKVNEITAEWLENFTVSSYYPMEQLLSREDFTFLSRQPGFDLSLYKKLRRDRLNIFRQYLHRAILDFNRLHTAARMIVPYSTEDPGEIAIRLVRLKWQFSLAVMRAQCSYVLCRIGFQGCAVRTLIEQLDAMSMQVSALTAARAA